MSDQLTAEDRLRLHVHDEQAFAFTIDDAESLVPEIDALRAELAAKDAAIERLVAERDEAREQALDQFAREYSEAYGCDPVAMANGRSNWRKSAEDAEAQRDRLKEALELIAVNYADGATFSGTQCADIARQALRDAP